MSLPIRPIAHTEVLARPDLLEAHYEELATDKARMELAPLTEMYDFSALNGGLFCLGMFDHGEMIGYSVNFVSQALHYRHLRVCQNDVLFLAKAYRSAGNGKALIDATEAAARERHAGLMLWHAKPNTPLDALMQALGNGVQDIVYSKGL